MVTNTILLVGGRKRDWGDYSTGFSVWFRPNMDSACAETIMTRLMGSSVGDKATVGNSSRLFEVRGCRGHCCCCKRRGKEVVETSSGTRIGFLYMSDAEVFRAQDAIEDDLRISKRGSKAASE